MFRRQATASNRLAEEENPFLLSFSDLMASLLAIFILALVVMMVQLMIQKSKLEEDRNKLLVMKDEYELIIAEKERLEAEKIKLVIERERVRKVIAQLKITLNQIDKAQTDVSDALAGLGLRKNTLTSMLKEMKDDLYQQGINVLVVEDGTVLRIPEEALSFESGKHRIPEKYEKTADLIGASLLKSLQKDEYRNLLDTVFIEGHTDAVPNRRPMGNWGLSTYRAISLWLHWTGKSGKFSELKEMKSAAKTPDQVANPLISTSGYADTRPTGQRSSTISQNHVLDNSTDRRIDIRFTLKTEKQDLGKVKKQLDQMKTKTKQLIQQLEDE